MAPKITTPVSRDAAPLSNLSSGRVNINTSHKYQTPLQNETTPKPITAAITIETASETLGSLDFEFVTSLFDVLTTLTLSFRFKINFRATLTKLAQCITGGIAIDAG
ncbi:MAG: hypothetical protein V3T39_05895 [Gammaproteobacteria bacterium]